MMAEGQGGTPGQSQGQHDPVSTALPNIGQITLHREEGRIHVVPVIVPGLDFYLKSREKLDEVIKHKLKLVAEALGIKDFEEDCRQLLAAVNPLLGDIDVIIWSFDFLQSKINEVRRDPVFGRISFKVRSWTFTYQTSELSTCNKLRSDLLAKGVVLKASKGVREAWDSFLAELLRCASVVEGDPGVLPKAYAMSQARTVISTMERLPYDKWRERGGEGVLLDQGKRLLVPCEQMAEVAKDCGVSREELSSEMMDKGAKVGRSCEKRAGNRKGSFWPVRTSWVDELDNEDGEGVEGDDTQPGGEDNSWNPSTPSTHPTSGGDDDGVHTHGDDKNKATELPQTIDTPDTPDISPPAKREESK